MFSEKQYFSALIFSHPKLNTTESVIEQLLGSSKFIKLDNVVEEDSFTVTHLQHYSREIHHRIVDPNTVANKPTVKQAKTKVIGGKTYYLYDCYLLFFYYYTNIPFYLFAAPYKNIIKQTIDAEAKSLHSEKLSFHSLNLIRLCKHFTKNLTNKTVNITRVSLRPIVGTSGIKSAILYGDNVLFSEPYERIKSYTIPSSIRFIHANGNGTNIGINTDKVGNWSFYLKFKQDLNCFAPLIQYFKEYDFFEQSYNDPRTKGSLDSYDDDDICE